MKTSAWLAGIFLLSGVASLLPGVEALEDLTGEDWVAGNAEIAESKFTEWKDSGRKPEDFECFAVNGGRADLIERMLTGDRLAETEIKAEAPPVTCLVKVLDQMPAQSACGSDGSLYRTVWRRITKDRFEIWTPTEGRLYDASGKTLATAKVRRGDGCGREWYGAFLPDGSWVTTDIDDRDDTLRMFSAKGKPMWSIKGGTLIPSKEDTSSYNYSLPLIAWARSEKNGKAWVVSVGSEFGRGCVKVTPDGKWTKVSCPWTECFPQQLGPRGMYTGKNAMSDDGRISITRFEPAHGSYVGWPVYDFSGDASARIPDGGKFGILPDAWAVFIEAFHDLYVSPDKITQEQRFKEKSWFFDTKGKYRRWIKGHGAGTSLKTRGMWVVQPDDSCLLVNKGFTLGPCMKFTTAEKTPLAPVELHDDIGLGLFLQNDQFVLGTWSSKF